MAEEQQKKTGKEEAEKEKVQKKEEVPQNSIARMYLQDEDFKEDQKEHQKKKSLVDMTRKEKRLLEKEKIQGMGFQKKMEYFFMYYKWVPILIVGLILAAVGGYRWYENAKIENVLSVAVVNTMTQDFTEKEEALRHTLGREGKYDDVSILSNFATDAEGTELEYYSQMSFMTQMQAGTIDVMIMPEGLYQSESRKGILENMETLLGEDVYKRFDGKEKGDCVIITDEEFIEDYGLVYDEVYVCVLRNSLNQENAAKWISSLQ